MNQPVLYSFRRCPYAMRARLAISKAINEPDQTLELREIVLKNKPQEMIDISAKATVPVLQLADATIIDESLDIMLWALNLKEAHIWLRNIDDQRVLIDQCDNHFKPWLDKYKYADRFPEHTQEYYRQQGEVFLTQLDQRLALHGYLFDSEICLADAAIFPFVRQFAHVDKNWFDQADYPHLQRWLHEWLESAIFKSIMKKYTPWEAGQEVVNFPEVSV